jgi:hypothetical protein
MITDTAGKSAFSGGMVIVNCLAFVVADRNLPEKIWIPTSELATMSKKITSKTITATHPERSTTNLTSAQYSEFQLPETVACPARERVNIKNSEKIKPLIQKTFPRKNFI